MKNVLLAGLAVAVAFQVSTAHAIVEVKKSSYMESLEKDRQKEKDALSTRGLDAKERDARRSKMSDRLSTLGGADSSELNQAIQKVVQIKMADGTTKPLSLEEVARTILADNESLAKNQAQASGADAAHAKEMAEFLKVSAQFLSLASNTRDFKALDADSQRSLDAFNKQLLVITKMDQYSTEELKSHVDVMNAAVAARVNPKVKGEDALVSAMSIGKDGQKISKDELKEKQDDLIGCEL